MRVFTQKFQIVPLELEPWRKPSPGQFPEYDIWLAKFNAVHPNIVLTENHDLDYRVIFKTPNIDNIDVFQIIGFYWGDETTLEAATYWAQYNQVANYNPQKRWVVTCSDDEHPAIGPAANMQIDDFLTAVQAVKQGYYLWSDSETLVVDQP